MQRVVETEYGRVRGDVADGIASFKGIPFGAPPVGELRWRAPRPAQPWSDERDCTAFGNDPMQPKSSRPLRGAAFSEDCLSVNVWAPAETPPEGAPVMVWLFGGSFMFGSASNRDTDGTAYARRGIVTVAPNSRTGVFAWLAHPLLSRESPDGVSGNYGLLDNVLALEWVQRNVARFGGDPRRVTVFGCSSGSAAITAMLTMPRTQGLFAQAILESAGSFRPLCPLDEAEHWGGMVGDDLAAMRAMPAEQLVALGEKIGPAVRQLTSPRILRPIWDGKLIAHDEMDAFREGAYYAVPTLVGSNADEGGFYVDTLPIRTREQYRAYLEGNFGAHVDEAAAVYPGDSEPEVLRSLAEVFGDTQFTLGARGLSRALSAREPRTYRYLFAHPTNGKLPVHGGEQVFVFGTGQSWDDDARAISETMQRAWAAFAATGDPNAAGVPRWSPYDAARDTYLTFAAGYPTGAGWRTSALDFLESYYEAAITSRRARSGAPRDPDAPARALRL
jgi:para-nitrobenzyl esterase